MRALVLFLLPLLLFCQFASAGFGFSSCLKVITALASRPSDIFDKFQREICSQGCRPTVPHWDLWTRNNTFVPAVRSMVQRLNIPAHEVKLIKMGDEAADVIKARCGPMLEGHNICSDGEQLAAFGNCFKRQFLRSALTNLHILLPMASDEACKAQLGFVNDEKLWEDIIPNNMREYAGACGGLGAQTVDGPEEEEHEHGQEEHVGHEEL